MKIREIMDRLFDWSPLVDRENRCDILVYGDEEKDVKKVATCIIATPDVLRKAKELGVELIINHEGTFHTLVERYKGEENYHSDPIYLAKKALVEEIDIPIYRFHDYSHFTHIDKINDGFLKKLGIEGEFDGKRTFVLEKPLTIDELESLMTERLNLHHIRLVGQRSKSVKCISLCVGAWGDVTLYEELSRKEIDAVICGEVCEYSICEYVRDSAQLGIDLSLFVLGHMGSERSGMEYVCDYINENIEGVEAVYIESGEVYA